MKELLTLHTIALAAGVIADLLIGDPHGIPHPIVAVGRLISFLEHRFLERAEGDRRRELRYGALMCLTVTSISLCSTVIILILSYRLHPYFGAAVEAVLTCYILAARSLYNESMKVYRRLPAGDSDNSGRSRDEHDSNDDSRILDKSDGNNSDSSNVDSDANNSSSLAPARQALSMIVGRDTAGLNREGITKACVETIAENTSDGVIAPLMYTAIGGPALGMLYKSINTMDSMVGYRNDKYEYYGKTAAKLDDIANLIPSRLSALLMICAAGILRICSARPVNDSFGQGHIYRPAGAFRIWRRDRRKHLSPNSAQTESACAGALGIRLGGSSYYGGKLVDKPYIGDPLRTIEPEDIRRANRLMFVTEGILFICAFAALRLLSHYLI